jgi:hypothetical protein
MGWRASALTAVILCIPEASAGRMKIQTVIFATDQHTITVIVTVAISLAHSAHILMVFIAAIGPAPTVHGEDGSFVNVEKYLLASGVWRGVLQIAYVGHLTSSIHIANSEAHVFNIKYRRCVTKQCKQH